MEIPLDLERRLERRWVVRTKRIGLKGCINRMPRPTKEECPLGLPLVITGDQGFGTRQEAEALSICSISLAISAASPGGDMPVATVFVTPV